MNDMSAPLAAQKAPPLLSADGLLETEPGTAKYAHKQVKRFWRWFSLALPDASAVMFRQKITGLDVSQYLTADADGKVDCARIERRITALRAHARHSIHGSEWSVANEVELLLLGLMGLEELKVEARRQLIDARSLKLPSLAEYETMFKELENDETGLRAMLSRLISDIQGRFRKRYLLREYIAAYTARVSLIFSLSTTLFMILVIGLSWLAYDYETVKRAANVAAAGAWEGPHMTPLMNPVRAFSSFYLAIAAGLFGAAFSMMAQTRKRVEVSTLEDMRANARFGMLLFRLGVGLGAAMILYFIFDSQVLGVGSLTPNLKAVGFEPADASQAPVAIGALSPNKDLSLLMLWSFIAGFSEVLVPSILRQTEGGAPAKSI